MPAAPLRLKFGDCEFDEQSGGLRRNGTSVILPNQLFRILGALIHRAGNVVTRDELRREVWPDGTFVDFEHGLNAGVRRLREAIGDSAAAPRLIETIPKRGYRFIAPVERISRDGSPEIAAAIALPPAPPRRLPRWAIVPLTLLASVPLLFVFHRLNASRGDKTRRRNARSSN